MQCYQQGKERERQATLEAEEVRRAEERETRMAATKEIEKFRERVCPSSRYSICILVNNFTVMYIFSVKFYSDIKLYIYRRPLFKCVV